MTKEIYYEIRNSLKQIIKGSDYEGHLFCVGGCVRDDIMGREIKDIDLVIDLPNGGILFSEWMKNTGRTHGEVITYPTYGTSMFRLASHPWIELECVQTRSESYERNSRNPETQFGTILEDCFRRDLTINSLYWDITNDTLLDLTKKGIDDINNQVIRTTSDPDIIFDDDPLRILRCIRFATRYNWEIQKETFEGMKKNSKRLEIISQERITSEFSEMICSDYPCKALKYLKDTNSMLYIIPELCDTYNMEQNKYHFGTVWEHTLSVVEKSPKLLTLRLAAILHDIGKIKSRTITDTGIHFYDHEVFSEKMSSDILTRMKYPNLIINEVCFLVRYHMITKQMGENPVKIKTKTLRKWQYKFGKDRFKKLMDIIDSDNKSHHPDYCLNNQVEEILKLSEELETSGKSGFTYQLPVTGKDIMDFLGLQPGPNIKIFLDFLIKQGLSNPDLNKEELLNRIKNLDPEKLKSNGRKRKKI